MKKSLRLYIPLSLVLVAMLVVATIIYGFAKEQLYDQEIINQQGQLHETMQSLMADKQNNAITLALSLTGNPLIQ